jgi:hypothetical protein
MRRAAHRDRRICGRETGTQNRRLVGGTTVRPPRRVEVDGCPGGPRLTGVFDWLISAITSTGDGCPILERWIARSLR